MSKQTDFSSSSSSSEMNALNNIDIEQLEEEIANRVASKVSHQLSREFGWKTDKALAKEAFTEDAYKSTHKSLFNPLAGP